MFLNDFFRNKLTELNEENADDQLPEKGAVAGSAIKTASDLAKKSNLTSSSIMKSVGKGALPGLALGQTASEVLDYSKEGKWPQAAIAAGSGIAGVALGPAGAVTLPAAGAVVNYCLDNPEECKNLVKSKPSKFRAFRQKDLTGKYQPVKRNFEENKENQQSFTANPDLIKSIVDVESGGRADAVSPKGALGRMQVMPATAKNPGFGVKPAQNFSSTELERVGQDYFNAMLNKYGGDKRKALIAYNMGPGAADRWLSKGANPAALPKETQAYVPKVLDRYAKRSVTPTSNITNLQQRSTRSTPAAQTKPVNRTTRKAPTTGRAFTPNPNWTPSPGPEFFQRPKPSTITPSRRPDSIEQILRNKRKLEKADLNNLLNLFRSNPDIFRNIDPALTNLVQSLGDLKYQDISESTNLTESIADIVNLIYNRLELTHGDLINLYGHEVVGDAIEEVAIKHNDDENLDIDNLAQEVLAMLRKRFENPSLNEVDKDSTEIEEKNAMIQLQADVDKIKNTLGVNEGKIYFNVMATPVSDLKTKFHLQKDNKGWYLRENADARLKLDALRAFEIL